MSGGERTSPSERYDARETPVKRAVRGDGAENENVSVLACETQGRTARAVLDAAVSEREFQAQVIQLASACGWLVHHQIVPYRTVNGRSLAITEAGTDKGFPDLVLVDQVRAIVLFVELKREGGRLSYAQMQWREAIVRAGGRFYIWRPSDWPEVERVLKGAA